VVPAIGASTESDDAGAATPIADVYRPSGTDTQEPLSVPAVGGVDWTNVSDRAGLYMITR